MRHANIRHKHVMSVATSALQEGTILHLPTDLNQWVGAGGFGGSIGEKVTKDAAQGT